MEIKESRTIRIGIAGFGYMGKQHLRALHSINKEKKLKIEILGVFDPSCVGINPEKEFKNINYFLSFNDLIDKNPDWLIIATPHDIAPKLCKKALSRDVKVFMEKPFGRNYEEALEMFSAQKFEDQLWVGFNYRFFNGINNLIQDIKSNHFGPLISLNILMGHGGKPGYEKNWKSGSQESGGGVLINEGVHIFDLCLLIAEKDIEVKAGASFTGFWGNNFEEECHFLVSSKKIPLINLQVSIVKWNSTFRIELYGTNGYGIVEGRDRSYGEQHYRRGEKWAWQSGKNQKETEKIISTDDGSDIFKKELLAVLNPNIENNIKPSDSTHALRVMKLASECRKKIKTK